MDEKEMIELKSLIIDLSNESSVNLLSQTLAELRNCGYSHVRVDIKTSPEQELKNSGLDIQVFRRIKEIQDLPDLVVINLMLAAKKLKESSYKERLFNE
jgi:hypothetical protein